MLLKNKELIFHGHGISEPIGLEYIASSISKYCLSIVFKSHLELEAILSNGLTISLFSATTAEWLRVIELNKKAKKRGSYTVVGGYHISGNYKYEKELTFDYIVVGEGEYAIVEIVKEILENNAYRNQNNTPKLLLSKPIQELDNLKFPIRKKNFLGNYMIHDLMYPAPSSQMNTSIILGSRGCSYNCSFCASGAVWGNGVRVRQIDNIIDEINEIQAKYNTNTFVFIDQSLGQKKDWTIKLCNAIINNKIKLNWYHQSNINIDKELIPLMAKAGCTKIGFGVEGISPKAVSNIKPFNSLSFEEINDLFDLCNHYGIFVKAYLILGFPWETQEIIEEYFQYLPRLKSNMVKISFFTPFPGTKDWESYSDQLVTKDWSKFDTVQMPVVRNPNISVDEYLLIRQKLFHAFYGSSEFKQKTTKILEKYPQYTKSYIEFYNYLKEFSMIPDNINLKELLYQRQDLEETCSYS